LLEITTSQVRLDIPNHAHEPLFPRSRDDYVNFRKDLVLLKERRAFLSQMTQMYKLRSIEIENKENSQGEEEVGSMQLEVDEIRKSHDYSKALSFPPSNENGLTQCMKIKSLGGYFWGGFKHILGTRGHRRSSSIDGFVVNVDQQHNAVAGTREHRRSSSVDGCVVDVDQQSNTNTGTRDSRRTNTINGSVIDVDQQYNTVAGTRDDGRSSTIDGSAVDVDQ
jgi:hypothetical protein